MRADLVSQTIPAALSSMPAMTIGLGPSRGISLVLPTLAMVPLSNTTGSMSRPEVIAECPRVSCL